MNDGRGLPAITYGRPWVVMSVGFAEEHESIRRKEIPMLVTWVPALLRTSIIVLSTKIESEKVPVDIESNTGAKSRGSRSEEMEKKGYSSKRAWHSLWVKRGWAGQRCSDWRITVTFVVTDNFLKTSRGPVTGAHEVPNIPDIRIYQHYLLSM